MRYPGKGKTVQMISKLITYATIVFGGTISGAWWQSLVAPSGSFCRQRKWGFWEPVLAPALQSLAASLPLRRTRRGSRTVSFSVPWKHASPG